MKLSPKINSEQNITMIQPKSFSHPTKNTSTKTENSESISQKSKISTPPIINSESLSTQVKPIKETSIISQKLNPKTEKFVDQVKQKSLPKHNIIENTPIKSSIPSIKHTISPQNSEENTRLKQQMELLISRMNEYKQAAVSSKQTNDLEKAKKYLISYKSMNSLKNQLEQGKSIGILFFVLFIFKFFLIDVTLIPPSLKDIKESKKSIPTKKTLSTNITKKSSLPIKNTKEKEKIYNDEMIEDPNP